MDGATVPIPGAHGIGHNGGPVLDFETPEAFEPFLQRSRYKGAHGGRGSAKSHFFAELLLDRCLEDPFMRAVCLREVQRSLSQSVKLLLEDKIKRYNLGYYFKVMSDCILLPAGGIITFQGMQNHTAETIKSLEGYRIALFEEAQACSQMSLDLLRPTIRLDGSELWFLWNPRSPEDPVDKFFRGGKPPPNSICVEVSYEDNNWFPQVLRDEMEYDRERDYEKYLHVWRGKYRRQSQAAVFKNFKVEDFDEAPEGTVFYFGGDWGFATDPTVLVRCWINGRTLYIDREVWSLKCEIDDTPALFAGDDPWPHKRWANRFGHKGIDGALKFQIRADSSNPQAISYLHNRGFNIVPSTKGPGSVEDGINFIKSYDVVIHKTNCPHVAYEFENYSYKVDPKTDAVLPILEDKKNHTVDSIRYALELVRFHQTRPQAGQYGAAVARR